MNRRCLVPVLNMAKYLFFEESSDEECEIAEKVDKFCEFTVPRMKDNQFQRHFRMDPSTFEDLLLKMHEIIIECNVRIGHTRVTLEKEVMVTLWYLSNVESFRSVADRFGISKSTCWSILYRICMIFLDVNSRFAIIKWPNRERQTHIVQNFNKLGFPGVIGCIDGSHVPIKAPKMNHTSYINRKNFHSLLLQGVCDHKLMFTDVYSGEVGSLHDFSLYKKSELYQKIQSGHIIIHDDYHLIGDLAYKLNTNLLVGFKNNGHLTERQKNFNVALSRCRVKIENAFALLKGRFRRLKLVETTRVELIPLLIVACCILHNICILKGDNWEAFIDMEVEMQEELRNNPQYILDLQDVPDANMVSILKRNGIMNDLPMRNQPHN